MSTISREDLFKLFKKHYNQKYCFTSEKSIDEGGYGVIYKAFDNDRKIEVAIKLFHDGKIADGTDRSWYITSKVIHNQIVPTHTVELFSDDNGLQYKAAVSRFVPGKSLRKLFEIWTNEPTELQSIISRDFSKTLVPSLLEVLSVCHKLGFGHGDLHEGNVMVMPTNYGAKNTFQALLIDFDNESIKVGYPSTDEKDKIDKDIRLLRRLLNYITAEWEWSVHFQPIYSNYNSVADMHFAWNQSLLFINKIESGQDTQQDFFEHIKPLAVRVLSGFNANQLLNVYRNIVNTIGKSSEFEAAFQQLLKRIREPDAWTSNVEVEILSGKEMDLYKRLFDS